MIVPRRSSSTCDGSVHGTCLPCAETTIALALDEIRKKYLYIHRNQFTL